MQNLIYIYNGKVCPRPKSLYLNGVTYTPPTDEHLREAGYIIEEEPAPNVEPYTVSYEDLVVSKIRTKYSLNDELGLLRQRLDKPEEFSVYHDFCELCKTEAKAEIETI